MASSLSALWWIRIRGLCKLPDERYWLRGKLGLVLMGRAMLSKPLIQFCVEVWDCVPPLFFDLRSIYGEGNEVVDCSYTEWTAAHQAPLSLGFSRQEYWSGLPFPSPKVMATSFKRSHALTAILSAPNPATGHCWFMPPLGQHKYFVSIFKFFLILVSF